jgi:peroxiredoxin
LVLAVGLQLEAQAATDPPVAGDKMPPIVLTVPENPVHQAYLGITGERKFTIPEIKAGLVIIEIFSMYCPFCQREAPTVNQLFEMIKDRQDIKMIGIGVGNTPFEVNTFKKIYDIQFPLFSDEDWTIHEQLGKCRTPYFIALKILPGQGDQIVFTQLGGIKENDPHKFLETIVQQSDLK